MKHLLPLIILGLTVSACAGSKSASVSPLQKKDKYLTCKEIELEQNEAQYYRKTAEKNKGPEVKNLLMPLGYVSTYISAEKAIDASDSRIEYLNRIYEILDCDNPQAAANQVARVPAGGGMARVAPMPAQPVYQRAPQPYYDQWYY